MFLFLLLLRNEILFENQISSRKIHFSESNKFFQLMLVLPALDCVSKDTRRSTIVFSLGKVRISVYLHRLVSESVPIILYVTLENSSLCNLEISPKFKVFVLLKRLFLLYLRYAFSLMRDIIK